jgi:DNA-binding transcriptional ArsR family regulator
MKNLDPELAREVTRLHADFCSALADTRRLLIIYLLQQGAANVGQLAEELGFSQPSVSRHLKILRERGLVQASRSGATVEYQLTDQRLIEALDLLRAVMRDQWLRRANLVDSASD